LQGFPFGFGWLGHKLWTVPMELQELILFFQRIKIRCYKMKRSSGTF